MVLPFIMNSDSCFFEEEGVQNIFILLAVIVTDVFIFTGVHQTKLSISQDQDSVM